MVGLHPDGSPPSTSIPPEPIRPGRVRLAAGELGAWVGRPWNNRGTQTYATIIAANLLWLHGANDRLATAALRTASTNLNGLGHDPVSVLITSAFWLDLPGWRAAFTLCAGMLLVLGPVERRIGTGRWLVAFAAGHVGATLVVAVGLLIGIHTGHLSPEVSRSIDVGWSYGGVCMASVLTYLLPRRMRVAYGAMLVAFVVGGLIRHPTYTQWGHLTAATIGLLIGPWVSRNATVYRTVPA